MGVGWVDCGALSSQVSASASHKFLRAAGYENFRIGQYQKALTCYVGALQTIETRSSNNALVVARDLNDIGVLWKEMGRYGDARKYYSLELEVLKPLGDAPAAALGEAYMQLGDLSIVEGSLSTAEADYKKSVTFFSRNSSGGDLQRARAMSALGRLYVESARYDEASRLLRQARVLAENAMPAACSTLMQILDSQASLLSETGRLAEAEKAWLGALTIAQNTFGENGLAYSALLLHLGQLYTELHEYRSAETILKQGLAAEQAVAGSDEMDLAIISSTLGNAYLQQRKLAEAEPLFVQTERELTGRCDMAPLACAAVRSYVGDFYMMKDQWQAAETEYESAFTMREKVLGDHPLVASSLLSMSRALRRLRRKKEAKAFVAQAQRIMSLPNNLMFSKDNTIDVRAFRSAN